MFGKSILALLAATTSISSGALSTAPDNPPQTNLSARDGIGLDQVVIGSIKLKMTRRTVLKKLGKPQQISQEQLCYGSVERLTYPGLEVDLEGKGQQKTVTRISTTRYGTDRGVQVGDSIEKAERAYAPSAKRDGNILSVPSQQYKDSRLLFDFDKLYRIYSISTHIDC
jgi:hypothetical protein